MRSRAAEPANIGCAAWALMQRCLVGLERITERTYAHFAARTNGRFASKPSETPV